MVIDAVGAGSVLTEAAALVNSRARILLFGLNHNAVAQIPPAVFTQKELQLVGSLGKAFTPAISLLAEKRVTLDTIVSHRFALKDIQEGIALLRGKEASRVVIYPNGDIPKNTSKK